MLSVCRKVVCKLCFCVMLVFSVCVVCVALALSMRVVCLCLLCALRVLCNVCCTVCVLCSVFFFVPSVA